MRGRAFLQKFISKGKNNGSIFMKRNGKRLISVLLIALLVCAMLPTTAFTALEKVKIASASSKYYTSVTNFTLDITMVIFGT